MIGAPITVLNHDTGDSIVINDHTTDAQNVIALQSYPTIEPTVRNNNTPRQGAHGEFRLQTYYGGLNIVLDGVIVGETEADVWGIKKEFDEIMQLSKGGYGREANAGEVFPPMFRNTVRLSFTTPDGRSVWCDATPVKSVSYDRPLKQNFRLNFQVILTANTPYLIIEGSESLIEASTLGSINYGFKLSTDVPFELNNEYLENEVTVTVDQRSLAVIKLFGSDDGLIINPRMTNLTNDSYIMIRQPLSGSGSYFEINPLYQEMKDQDGRSVEAFSDGDYLVLDEGDNVLVYTADNVIPN